MQRCRKADNRSCNSCCCEAGADAQPSTTQPADMLMAPCETTALNTLASEGGTATAANLQLADTWPHRALQQPGEATVREGMSEVTAEAGR
jgi:hypothetical protein